MSNNVVIFQPLHAPAGQDALQPPQTLRGVAGRDCGGHFPEEGLRCITWNTTGLVGSVFLTGKPRTQTQTSQEVP